MPPRRARTIDVSLSLGELASKVSTPMTHQTMLSTYAGQFTINTLRRAYRLFDGDLTLFLVFGEIAHYNMSHVLQAFQEAPDSPSWKARMRGLQTQKITPCNALSISAATGIPRETVRRKVKELEKRGWLARKGARSLTLAPQAIEHMEASGGAIMDDFKNTAQLIRMLEDAFSRQRRKKR
jgi:hypothetical protein